MLERRWGKRKVMDFLSFFVIVVVNCVVSARQTLRRHGTSDCGWESIHDANRFRCFSYSPVKNEGKSVEKIRIKTHQESLVGFSFYFVQFCLRIVSLSSLQSNLYFIASSIYSHGLVLGVSRAASFPSFCRFVDVKSIPHNSNALNSFIFLRFFCKAMVTYT